MSEVVEIALLWTGDQKVLILRIYAELNSPPPKHTQEETLTKKEISKSCFNT